MFFSESTWRLKQMKMIALSSGLIYCVRTMCQGVCLSVSFHSQLEHVIPRLVKSTKNTALAFQMWPQKLLFWESTEPGPENLLYMNRHLVVLHWKQITCINWLVSHCNYMVEAQLNPFGPCCAFHPRMSTWWWAAMESTKEAIWYLILFWLELLSARFSTVILNVVIWSNMHD